MSHSLSLSVSYAGVRITTLRGGTPAIGAMRRVRMLLVGTMTKGAEEEEEDVGLVASAAPVVAGVRGRHTSPATGTARVVASTISPVAMRALNADSRNWWGRLVTRKIEK